MTDEDPTDPAAYYEFRDHMADDLRKGLVSFTAEALAERAIACSGLKSKALAVEWVERFTRDMQHRIDRERRRSAKPAQAESGSPTRAS